MAQPYRTPEGRIKQKILIVDDDLMVRETIAAYLTNVGFDIHTAPTLEEARERVSERLYDAVILDQLLPDGNGIDLIRELRSVSAEMAIIVITGAADIPLAVKAMQEGADNFLPKPISFDSLLVFLRKSLDVRSLRRISRSRKRLEKLSPFDFGTSAAMKLVKELALLAADNISPTLVTGETGVGKGVLARWIHEHSERNAGVFVEVNCSGLRGELLASELFGHCKGAFTSAVQDRQGLLDVADGGTLFLDEIGDMDITIQSQFLKVIEEKSYRRLGEVRLRSSDFRLICATNKDLLEESSQGRFRKDLLYRIQVMPITIPPLRERIEDIANLAQHILASLNSSPNDISPEALSLLAAYPWPGNVRELRNVLERARMHARGAVLSPKFISGLHVPERTALQEPSHGLINLEREAIKAALRRACGDTLKAAQELGISRATIYRKLKKNDLQK